MNSKLTAERLARRAIVYVRQSSPGQVIHNQESQRRQYELADRARELGFSQVTVIDDDLGRSGSGLKPSVVGVEWSGLQVAPRALFQRKQSVPEAVIVKGGVSFEHSPRLFDRLLQ